MADPVIDDSFDQISFDATPEPNWGDTPIDRMGEDDEAANAEIVDDIPDSPEDVAPRESHPTGPRESVADYLGMGWSAVGSGLVHWTPYAPSGRVMQLQSLSAGEQLDNLIRDTFVDRVLQRFMGAGGMIETVGALVAGPILAGMIHKNQQRADKLGPMLVEAIMQSAIDSAKVLEKQEAKARERKEALAKIAKAQGMDIDDEAAVLNGMMQFIFEGPGGNHDESDETA